MRSRLPRELTVSIESTVNDGFGLASAGERVVRVKNALQGETVSARVLKRRKGEWLAEAFAVENPSAQRAAAACAYYPRCGGCAMQHIDYPSQLALKEQHLLEALADHSVQPIVVKAAIPGPRFAYRTKARLGVRLVDGQVLVGFRESFSNRVAHMDACLTLAPELSALINPLQQLISELSCPDRIPQVEVAAGDSGCAVILRHLEVLSERDLELISSFARVQRVQCFVQSGDYATVASVGSADCATETDACLSYANPDYGIHLLFRPMDFTQVNLTMNRQLVRAALIGLNAPKGSRVLDLFCGIGNFSLALAASGLDVIGIEASAEAIDRARMNAEHNGLQHRCEFAVRDLYDADCLDLDCLNPDGASHLLLDPPRSGAGPNLQNWVRGDEVQRIAYVSCSPESFSADAGILAGMGFELEHVGIFDMFPHTAHVETLGVFQRKW